MEAITVGITGGIGSGKSFICGIVQHLGYPVYFSDDRASYIRNHHPKVLEGIQNYFGPEFIDSQGIPIKEKLSERVFNHPEDLTFLNELIHPLVKEDFIQWHAQQHAKLCFKEAAILFETGGYKALDYNVLVTAPETLRISRVQQRDGHSREEIQRRISKQWSDEQKRELADFEILNDQKTPVLPQLDKILKEITGKP